MPLSAEWPAPQQTHSLPPRPRPTQPHPHPPEHARHFDEVARRAYSSGKDDANLYRPNGGDELPTSAPPPPPAEGPSNGVPK
jgi:hypothetical protein